MFKTEKSGKQNDGKKNNGSAHVRVSANESILQLVTGEKQWLRMFLIKLMGVST